jgi:uncharacterized LabA/DUF88 family protein
VSKNVAVFVDVANIFYAAKAAGVDIDYVTLLKSATAGRDFVRAYAYTGLDPENENQRQFHSFLARSGYKVVSKDIRKYGDGRIKANLDIELVVDMMRIAQHIDIAVVVSGDGDFAPAIRAVQQLGVRCEVISFRGNTSSDLIEVADVFTDITQIARVEKGARSGRRVAAEDDLSMTEVPDKETEGGARRRRGGRRVAERPVREERAGRVPVAANAEPAGSMPGNLIVLPGEKLSRAVGDEGEEPLDLEELAEEILAEQNQDEAGLLDADGRRRRRRRGGRGRGRGRRPESESEIVAVGESAAGSAGESVREPVVDSLADSFAEDEEYLDEEIAPLPQHSTFGSVWDSQIGVPSTPVGATPSTVDDLEDEDLEDEPEIPEYLLAERRQQGQNRGRGGGNRMQRPQGRRGGAGYQSAVDNVRYGRSGTSAFGGGGGGGGMPRMPDRNRAPMGGNRGPRPQPQQQSRPRPRPSYVEPAREIERPERPASSEPWSEVPPEVQEMLRAELARRQSTAAPGRESTAPTTAPMSARPARGRAPSARTPRGATAPVAETSPAPEPASSAGTAPTETAAPRRRTAARSTTTRSAAPATAETAPPADAGTPVPKARRTRTAAPSAKAAEPAEAAAQTGDAPDAKPRRTATRRPTSSAGEAAASGTASGAADTAEAKPKRRAARTTAAASTEPASEG